MEKIKVLWLSRHEMTAEQAADLAASVNRDLADLEIVPRNITWQATADAAADYERNKAEWAVLMAEIGIYYGHRGYLGQPRGGCIAGVFPPVALSAINRRRPHALRLYTPVSRQAPELRVGDGPIPFQHLRWTQI